MLCSNAPPSTSNSNSTSNPQSELKTLKSALTKASNTQSSQAASEIIPFKPYPHTDSTNTSANTSNTSTHSTNTCASSLSSPDSKMTTNNPPRLNALLETSRQNDINAPISQVSATGQDFTSATQLPTTNNPSKPPTELVFTKKAILRKSCSSTQTLSALVASSQQTTSCNIHNPAASRTSSTSSSSSFSSQHSNVSPTTTCDQCVSSSTTTESRNQKTSSTSTESIISSPPNKSFSNFSRSPILSVEIGAQFSFKSTNHISNNPNPNIASNENPSPGLAKPNSTTQIVQPANTNGGSKPYLPSETSAPSMSSSGSMDSRISHQSSSASSTTSPPTAYKMASTHGVSPTKTSKSNTTSPEKPKRMASECVLPTLFVREPSNVKLLGLFRANLNDDTRLPLDAPRTAETVSLPASPTSTDSILSLPGLARRNGSSTSLVSAATISAGFSVQPPRQLRSLKTPLYVPSVLRRTVTLDQLSGLAAEPTSDVDSAHSTLKSLTLPNTPTSSAQSSPRSSSALFGAPSRSHWKPNNSRSSCKGCGSLFSLFSRRHHCRKCGDVFCDKDTTHFVRLDQTCEFNILGQSSKACNACHKEYVEFVENADVTTSCLPTEMYDSMYSEYNSGSSSASTTSLDDHPRNFLSSESNEQPSYQPQHKPTRVLTGVLNRENDSNATLTAVPALLDIKTQDSATVAGSVPANWSWSTF